MATETALAPAPGSQASSGRAGRPRRSSPRRRSENGEDHARAGGDGPACGLRIAVRGGGCSGFEYAIDFEKEPRENDLVLEYDGLNVYVDPISSRFLEGTTIDYSLGMTGTGFKFHNPKASGTCGCGSSFSV